MKSTNDPKLIEAIFQWDIRNWSKVLDFWTPHLPTKGKALTLGERDGGLSLWLAKQGLQVVCTDLNGPTDKAAEIHEQWEVDQHISYEAADMTQLPYDDASFDVVAFKSVIGGLGDKSLQAKAIGEIHRVLKPGGKLLLAENLAGTQLHQFFRAKFTKWAGYWRYLHAKKDLDLFQAFSQVETKTIGVSALVGRSEKARNGLARVDRVLTPVVPKTWRYIWFVVARR